MTPSRGLPIYFWFGYDSSQVGGYNPVAAGEE